MDLNTALLKLPVTMGLNMEYRPMEKKQKELYKEAHRCLMCGNTPTEPKKSNIVEEIIDGTRYSFDSNGCALAFRKLSSVLGEILY